MTLEEAKSERLSELDAAKAEHMKVYARWFAARFAAEAAGDDVDQYMTAEIESSYDALLVSEAAIAKAAEASYQVSQELEEEDRRRIRLANTAPDLQRVRRLEVALRGGPQLSKNELLWLGASPEQREFLEAFWEAGHSRIEYLHGASLPPPELVRAAKALARGYEGTTDGFLVGITYEDVIQTILGENYFR